MNIIREIFDKKKDKTYFIPYLLLFLSVIFMIKYTKINNLKYDQTCKKKWSRKIFNYLRNDNDMIEKIDNDKVYFFKKNKKNKIKKICGLEQHSSVNVNTSFPMLKDYCNNKKKFLYVIDSEYTPTTLFVDFFTQTENNLNFKKYILKKTENNEQEIIIEEDIISHTQTNKDQDNNNNFSLLNDETNIDDKSIISNKCINLEGGRFIKKPLVGSQGFGIEIIDKLNDCFLENNEINNNFIFQEEIIPKLKNGYKFDIRYFAVLVVTQKNIEIKHIPNAFLRLCSKKFSKKNNDLYSNLTNTSLNKDIKCTMSICKIDEEWEKYFDQMKIITNNFFENVINEVGRESFFEINGDSIASTRIFGFDFIISQDDKIFILEVNYGPADNTYYGSECKEKVIEYYAKKIKKLI